MSARKTAGTQTAQIVEEHSDKFDIVAMAAGRNVDVAEEQAKALRPQMVGMQTKEAADALADRLSEMGADRPEIVHGRDGACEVAAHSSADCVVTGIVGCAGLQPTVSAIKVALLLRPC